MRPRSNESFVSFETGYLSKWSMKIGPRLHCDRFLSLRDWGTRPRNGLSLSKNKALFYILYRALLSWCSRDSVDPNSVALIENRELGRLGQSTHRDRHNHSIGAIIEVQFERRIETLRSSSQPNFDIWGSLREKITGRRPISISFSLLSTLSPLSPHSVSPCHALCRSSDCPLVNVGILYS